MGLRAQEKVLSQNKKKGMYGMLYTNGVLLDDNFINFLKDINIEAVKISLDGATPKTHDYVRGKQGAFEKFVIEINVEDDNDTIINKLKHYLDNQEELKKITQRGYLLMNKYTQDWYASVFINKLNSILNS